MPHRTTRLEVVTQASHVALGLAPHHRRPNASIRVVRAAEGEILPDQDAELVAHVVEVVALVKAAAPDAQHVHAGVERLLDARAVLGFRDGRGERMIRDPVGAERVEALPVDLELEGLAEAIRFAHQAYRPQPDPSLLLIERRCRGTPSASLGSFGTDSRSKPKGSAKLVRR